MTHFPSNGWFAWISGLLSLAFGVGTYSYLGDAHAGLDPLWALVVALTVVTVAFYVLFGLLSMRWFGGRYWVYAPLWNAAWLAVVVILGDEWMRTLGILYAGLSLVIVGRLAPDGELNDRLRSGRRP